MAITFSLQDFPVAGIASWLPLLELVGLEVV